MHAKVAFNQPLALKRGHPCDAFLSVLQAYRHYIRLHYPRVRVRTRYVGRSNVSKPLVGSLDSRVLRSIRESDEKTVIVLSFLCFETRVVHSVELRMRFIVLFVVD